MTQYEVQYRNIEKKMDWEDYRSERCEPFRVKADAEEYVRSAQVYANIHSLPWVFRIVEVPLPWDNQD